MKISTSQFYLSNISNILDIQREISDIQTKISSGKKYTRLSDEPEIAARTQNLNNSIKNYQRYQRNASEAISHLSASESLINEAVNRMQRARELTVQANNTTLSADDRSAIAIELTQIYEQLIDVANSKSSSGAYMFAGGNASSEPFVANGSGNITYQGNQTSISQKISGNQSVKTFYSGWEVFNDIKTGNGYFIAEADTSNTGSGTPSIGAVTSLSDYRASKNTAEVTDFQIVFVDDGGTLSYEVYTVPDDSSNAGPFAYTDGAAINFGGKVNGITLEISGTPEVGDTFDVKASQAESIFTTLENVISSLQSDETNHVNINQRGIALNQIDRGLKHLLQIQTQMGSSLSNLESIEQSYDDRILFSRQILSDLEDVDLTSAIGELSQYQTALEVAQRSFTSVQKMTLFNYIS